MSQPFDGEPGVPPPDDAVAVGLEVDPSKAAVDAGLIDASALQLLPQDALGDAPRAPVIALLSRAPASSAPVPAAPEAVVERVAAPDLDEVVPVSLDGSWGGDDDSRATWYARQDVLRIVVVASVGALLFLALLLSAVTLLVAVVVG